MKKHYSIRVHGRVQNVGFRFYTRRKAAELEITGYVKNETDGSVSIEAEGSQEKLEEFALWCHKGPEWARVDDIQVNEEPLKDFDTFSVR